MYNCHFFSIADINKSFWLLFAHCKANQSVERFNKTVKVWLERLDEVISLIIFY